MYIGIIEFQLLKHRDELDIKTTTLLGGTTLLLGGGVRSPVPPSGYGLVSIDDTIDIEYILVDWRLYKSGIKGKTLQAEEYRSTTWSINVDKPRLFPDWVQSFDASNWYTSIV